MSYIERKAQRTKHYKENVEGWKLRTCGACNGSGWYDSTDDDGNPIPCGACDGTGKERYKPEVTTVEH